ncbi:urease accessory protein UreF [Streptomyces sp. CA2R106]|uniref:urease accessory protein UreF n=1 Tax=Streptomyces sp. CA2R106 TaxID=3120153 RepID=UPI003007F344
MTRTALLLLADGRFPAGGHAHSGGVEAAVAARTVHDPATLLAFCRGRLHTSGLTAAALAAAAAAGHDPLDLDGAAAARTPAPALRATARKLGRQLLRAARAIWPCEALDRLARDLPGGAHHPVVLGVTATAAGLTGPDAAHAVALDHVSGPAAAAVRLLGLDPFDATAVVARLCDDVEAVARRAADAADRVRDEGTAALPAACAPLLDITAEQHAVRPVRLFAS